MDPREVAFLASQAERLASTKKQHGVGGGDDDNDNNDAPDTVSGTIKTGQRNQQSTKFFADFRKICSGFQNELDSLLRRPTSSAGNDATATTIIASNDEDAKSYYATASKRNEGRMKLDTIQKNVRLLQNHVLSSTSSSSLTPNLRNNDTDSHTTQGDSDTLLQSILQTPMGEITQTDMRLLSQEITKIMKCIDEARELICPKEKFVFKRYRAAMEKAGAAVAALDNDLGVGTAAKEACMTDKISSVEDETKLESDNLRSKYGGVVENLSNSTIEISSENTIHITVAMANNDRLEYYSSPRSIHALHPSSSSTHAHHSNHVHESSSSSSYLLQNLHNVTILLHGSRPSLHLQNIHNCKIYITEPILGAVHVTNAQSSTLHCSCYQLRVHDSKDVQFTVWTRSGPIIEGCTDMVFMGNYYLESEVLADNSDNVSGNGGTLDVTNSAIVVGRNMYWDVKDFNWLRALRKSPNFVVVDMVVATKEKKPALDTKDVLPTDTFAEVATTTVDEEDDSEDEL
ncbi:hypothetical protein ACHAWU_004879 [Discostella pseudostelligera]|uniref:C-CAP/cofactor C-like domain-containing protein n=1 Tax=Discostella pseudostelligera TaxID=259834 RepID=A0ABD3M8D9_9STRA